MIIWNPTPEIFSIGSIAPRWYGLCFAVAFFIGEKYCSKIMLKHGYNEKEIFKLFSFVLAGTIIGARLGHCLFYEPSYYLSNPLEILYVWKGGLASHGGFLGVMIGAFIFNKKVKKIDYLWLLDLVAAPALMAGGFIRIGNLMNSEILGHPTDVPWAFVFKQVDNIPRHPTAIYEALGFFTASAIVYFLYAKKAKKWPRGRFVGIILCMGMSWRFIVEFFKENQVAFENGMFFNMGQILSLIMLFLGIFLVLRKPKEI